MKIKTRGFSFVSGFFPVLTWWRFPLGISELLAGVRVSGCDCGACLCTKMGAVLMGKSWLKGINSFKIEEELPLNLFRIQPLLKLNGSFRIPNQFLHLPRPRTTWVTWTDAIAIIAFAMVVSKTKWVLWRAALAQVLQMSMKWATYSRAAV